MRERGVVLSKVEIGKYHQDDQKELEIRGYKGVAIGSGRFFVVDCRMRSGAIRFRRKQQLDRRGPPTEVRLTKADILTRCRSIELMAYAQHSTDT